MSYKTTYFEYLGSYWSVHPHKYFDSQHVHSDMHFVVEFVSEHLGADATKRLATLYRTVKVTDVNQYIDQNLEVVSNFIAKTAGQRLTFFKKIIKSNEGFS